MKKVLAILAFSALLFGCQNDTDSKLPIWLLNPTGTTSSGSNQPSSGQVSTNIPVFEPIGGFYKEKQTVKITCDDSAAIYYTILKPSLDSNGNWDETAWKAQVANSIPSTSSTKYEGPFEVSEQCIIRALAVKTDGSRKYAMTSFDFDLDRSTDFTGSWTPVNPQSENWQDQTIYFILTDRFFNGDTTNDKVANLKDQNGNLYDETKVLEGQPASGYNGGDIEGIRQKLQYIKDLGFTAIWMTPPVKCQIAEANYHGFHGYWASDFTKVDSHMGTLAQYQQFVKEAHELGLYVIQDIVVNHLGDYQKIAKDITEDMMKTGISASDFYLEPKSVPFNHPEQLPWALNNINDLLFDEWKNSSFYHYNSPISDYTNLKIQYDHSSSDLDDMKTESPVVRNLLRGYFRYWIDKAGIDGYRIDTALYVEPEFFEGFINDKDANNMGVREYGLSKGKKDFIDFGEAFSQDEKIVGSYTKSDSGTARMDGMIYFPLRYALADTISSGAKTSKISTVLKNRYNDIYKNPERLVTFIDNHDMDRWGKIMNGNEQLMKAAYNIIYTIPGIPQVYYGSEQGFTGECRAGMFKGSYLTPGTTQPSDLFDTTNSWYKYFQNLNKMRKEHKVFRYNALDILQDTSDSAGIFAYIVREKDENGNIKTDGEKAILIMNTARTDKILNASSENIAVGDKYSLIEYDGVSVCPASGTALVSEFVGSQDGDKGNVKLIVPGNSCAIYILKERGSAGQTAECTLTVDEVPTETIKVNEVTIKGTSSVTGTVKIIMNGDCSLSTDVSVTAGVQFTKTVNVISVSNGTVPVRLIQVVNGVTCFSNEKSFTLDRPFKLISKVTDPKDDDNGVGNAKGKLSKPTDPSFTGTMDIQGVDAYRSGNDILLGVKMSALAHGWNPTSNFFDHVVFYVFVSDGDDTTGCEYHSGSNYQLPSAFGKWDYMYQANGWGQAYYSSKDATKDKLGTAVTPAPVNEPAVDWANIKENSKDIEKYATLDWSDYNPSIGDEFKDKPGMVWFKVSAAAMGSPVSIKGYKFYINTYDFDMGSPRGIKAGDPEQYKFGTGSLTIAETPVVCDETDNIIVISE